MYPSVTIAAMTAVQNAFEMLPIFEFAFGRGNLLAG
jgi:hypothetical protein